MKKIIDKKRGEKGAITLFVLLACLFFVFTLSGVYISNLNKLQAQEKQMRQIQENYARDIDRVDEIYESLARDIIVTISKNTEEWTDEVTLTGKATAKERGEIKEYIFEKDGQEIGEWTKVEGKDEIEEGNNIVITKKITVTENGEYTFVVRDEEENSYSSTIIVDDIDKTLPTPGTLKAKEETEDGWTDVVFDNNNEIRTDKSVRIEKVDGSDNESGHKKTTMTIQQNGITVEKWKEIEESQTLTETGTYTITVTTEDNAGNKATSEPYVVYIDKIVPILALKHNDENGADYEEGTWTKDDLYGEITIDTTKSGKTVEKYQYSENGIIWEDISDEPVIKALDYTTTFPMSGDKPEWIKGPINNDASYYFEVQADGTLKSNNNGVNSSTANSYFEIDLTDYPDASLTITINAEISSETNYDKGYATIQGENDTVAQAIIKNGTTEYISGVVAATDYSITITGGQKYTLTLKYTKDGSANGNSDEFTINSITLKSNELGKGINFNEYTKTDNKVTFKLQDDIEKEIYIRAVYTGEDGESKYGEDKTSIKIDKKAPKVKNSNVVILSKTEARADINVKENGSGIRGYYISTEQTKPTETSTWTEQLLKEFTIEGLNTDTTYYLWIIDKVGNISEKHEIVIGTANYTIDDKESAETLEQAIAKATDGSSIKLLNDYTDTSTVTINKNVTLDIQNYTLTRDQTITISSGKTVEITGTGTITTGTTTVSTITNNGTLTISNSITIENMSTSTSYAPISNNNSAVTNINDSVIINGYYRGIYNYYGTININGGIIKAIYSNSSAYGIYNGNYSDNSKVYINNGIIEGYNGIYNCSTSGPLEMNGGKVVGTGSYGISGGTVNIYGGRVEGKTYGIYNSSTDKVTIGKQEDELSTTQPAIYGTSYGIYMSNQTYSFNFYNGVIISNTEATAYRGTLNARENYMPYTYFDYEIEGKYCTILTPTVENITMEAEPTEYTNGDVTVKITYPYIEGTIKQYSEDGIEWEEASQYIQEILVSENKTIYGRTLNESGVITEENQIEINNIDKEKPTVTISPNKTSYSVASSNGTVDLTLTITAIDTGGSGLDKMQYGWAQEGEKPTYTNFSNTLTITKTNLGIGQYNLYINVTDKAGNIAEVKQMRYTVKYEEPVAQIGSTKYTTVQAAVDACSKSAGNTQTTIIMLKSTDEEFATYEGQNIILDLKGYTIGSSSIDAPICTNNAKLQLISSTGKTGKLESLNGTAVLNNGTFTLGDSSTDIEMEVPTIYGYKIGISNQNVFNFYDGKIQGIAAIQGNVQDTPEEYGPVSTDLSNGITTMQLGIVTGYEARIDWVYYTTVQEAIDATKVYQNGQRDTVTIIKDIQLEEIATVEADQNLVLDLDRYELTVVSEKDRVINNYGKLEITDSSIEQTGEIKIESTSSCYGIYNNSTGIVEVSGGTVSSSSSNNSSYGIYNNSTGIVEVSGGTVSSSSSSSTYNSYGVYNRSKGTLEINGGEITSSSSSYSYGISNNTGTVEVRGGTVSCSGSKNSYGIYNDGSTGTIKINGGKIISSSSSNTSYGICNNTGTVEVSGGTVSCNSGNPSYGIYNGGSTGTIKINGGKIISSSSTYNSYGIYNNSTGIIEINRGEITSSSSSGSSHGIYNKSTGTVEVSGGTVSSNSSSDPVFAQSGYGIFNESTGSIIIGSNDNSEVLNDTPVIIGEYTGTKTSCGGYGIYNKEGDVEFYNGTIQGDDFALIGNITKLRDGYKIYEDIINDKKLIYPVKKANEEYLVQIGETKYLSIQEAIDSIEKNEEKTIQVIKNFELEEVIRFNKNIILDLNGYTITNKYYRIENIGSLKITDTTENGEGTIKAIETIQGVLNQEGAKILIEKGTLCSISTSKESSKGKNYGICNYGTIEVTGGTVSSESSINNNYGIYNNEIGIIKVSGGIISSKCGVGTSSATGWNYGIYSKNAVEIMGGTINSISEYYSYGVYIEKGTIEITGGTINSITDEINENSYGISIGEGTGKITGGVISSISGSRSYGISNGQKGSIQIVNGEITSSTYNSMYSNESYGINNYGTIEILGGTVNSNCDGGSNSSSYGIYNYSTGTLTMGTKGDGLVSKENPSVNGENAGTSTKYVGYGIYNKTGILYFYDGIIQGKTKAIEDTITEREENTELSYSEDETVLTLSTTLTPVAQIGETTYTSLQEAIDSAGTGQTIITLLRNVAYTINDTTITIPNTKNIILDLKGYKIASSILEKTIQNEGILEITDTSVGQTGIIVTAEEKTISNLEGAKLTLSGGTIENRTSYAIFNEGEVSIQEGTVSSSNSSNNNSYGIYNNGTGKVEISGGTVSSNNSSGAGYNYSYGTYNASTGEVKISGGTVSSSSSGAGYNYSYGTYNASTGEVEVSGGTVSSSSSGVNYNYSYGTYNASTGGVKVSGGTVSSSSGSGSSSGSEYNYSYGIYNNTGTIIIGRKGDGTVSQETPYIKGEYTGASTEYVEYGLYNNEGKIYFYDGKIEGTTKAINGNIEEIEDLTELLITTDSNGNEIIQLQQVETNVAEVSGVEYDSIQEAVEACGTTARTIKVLRNSNPGATVIVEQGQNITLDLNGFTTNTYQEITNKGTLKIIDTSTGQAGKIKNSTGIAVSNKGTMEVQSGSIADSGYGIQNTGTLNITGGNIQNNSYGIYNDGSGIVNTSGGNITSNTYGIYNYGSSVTSNITGGTISSNDYGTFNAGGTTNITSAGITNNEYGVYVSGGTTNIKEGTKITSNIGVGASGGTLNIGETGTMNLSSPVITGEEYGLFVASTGTVYMYDGQIKGKIGATKGYITYTEAGYQVATKVEGEYMIDYLALAGTISTVAQVNGISFSNLQSAINSIVGEETQTVKLTNGIISDITFTVAEGQNVILDMNGKTITSDLAVTIENAGNLTIIDSSGKNVAKISSSVGIVIKNTGTLTLGQDDGTVNQELITIDGTTYGIETSGTLNFYDGTINGASAVNGTITSRAAGYVIRTTTVEGKERYYLST